MTRLLIASILLFAPAFGIASGGEAHLEDANIDLRDKESLQRGAHYFVDYCMGCHSLKYMRYNRMGQDLGLDNVQVRQEFIFNDAKPGDLMMTAMRPDDGEKWFGIPVPDLTLVTRRRSPGPDWVYTYLKSFYLDENRPFGVNNVVFPDVGMPHVLADLQGMQKVVDAEAEGGEGKGAAERFELVERGSMTPEEYDGMVRDLTNFLTYAGEPMKLERQHLGIYVLLFLGVLFILAYALKKEYWKDVH
jgi:ubiquinol-cytochrome c reductase cytochrome c1 subunit